MLHKNFIFHNFCPRTKFREQICKNHKMLLNLGRDEIEDIHYTGYYKFQSLLYNVDFKHYMRRFTISNLVFASKMSH